MREMRSSLTELMVSEGHGDGGGQAANRETRGRGKLPHACRERARKPEEPPLSDRPKESHGHRLLKEGTQDSELPPDGTSPDLWPQGDHSFLRLTLIGRPLRARHCFTCRENGSKRSRQRDPPSWSVPAGRGRRAIGVRHSEARPTSEGGSRGGWQKSPGC